MLTHVKSFRVNGNAPRRGRYRQQCDGYDFTRQEGTHTSTRSILKFIQEAYPAEGTSTPPGTERWKKMVDITQFMRKCREILRELCWMILVLIP